MRIWLFFPLLIIFYKELYAQSCNAPATSDVTICAGSPATLTVTDPGGGTYQWYDSASGGSLLATGTSYTTPSLTENTTYYVQTINGTCISPRTSATVNVRPRPAVSGITICAGEAATLTATGPGGNYTWFDAPSGGNLLQSGLEYRTPVLTATTTYFVQTRVEDCISSRTAVVVTVNSKPDVPAASDVTICSGTAATLTATAPGGTYQWFTTAEGGTPLITSPDFTTPVLTATTTYFVQTTINGCTSSRTPVTVTVNPIPLPPIASNTSICSGTSSTLTATGPGGTYQWFGVASRGNPLATGNSFTTPLLTRSTIYYVQTLLNGCISIRTPVAVTVNQSPEAPTVRSTTICSGSSATLSASAPGGIYAWYDAPTGGNLLITSSNYATPPLTTTTTYYVQTTVNGCTSGRAPVMVSVIRPPAPPVASGNTICAGTTATLSATGEGGIYAWYDAASGGNLLLANPEYTTPALSVTTTYYVQTTVNSCASARTPVTVAVNPTPRAPSASGTTICPGSAATLTATAPGGTLQWYDAASGGSLLATGAAFTTPVLTSNTTYYVQTTVSGCTSSRTPVTVSVSPIADPEFRYSSGTYCVTGTNPTPAIYTPSGGTFSASPAGLVFISNTTGQINLSASALGTYIVTFVNNGPCPGISNASITITDAPNPSFSYNGPYCQSGTDPAPTFLSTSSAGVFTSSPTGLVFTTNGTIDLSESRPGTYTVTNTIPANGACTATSSTDIVTIYASRTVDAGPDQAVSPGSTVFLSGTITGAGGFRWSGGTGTFSDPAILNPVYTPGPDESRITLYLTGSGACSPQTDSLIITINFIAPTASGATICTGNTAILTATAPEGTYQWYDAASGGNLLTTNHAYVTPPLTATTTYYVQAVIAGSTSARTPVTVRVNPIPAAPTVPGVTICTGNPATLAVTAPVTGASYQWYDDPASGNLLATTATYTTPILMASTIYYVQTITDGCISVRTAVPVTVSPAPVITSAAIETICSNVPQNYTITADVSGATFIWSRAAVPNISNTAAANQTSSRITETLVSTAVFPVDVTYIITPTINGCAGPPFNYTVTVDPAPVVTSPLAGEICNFSASNYTITYNMLGTSFSWSRAAVPGISNAPIFGQTSGTIREVLTNTTNVPVDVTYTFNQSYNQCDGPAFNYVVRVNPIPQIISSGYNVICNRSEQIYVITANVTGTTFTWNRAAVPNIANAPVTGRASSAISETLINTGTTPTDVIYSITPTANGCTGPDFNYRVTVNPTPVTPIIISNSPVCINSTITLSTTQIPGASYLWTGPNGFTATQQNVTLSSVTQANAGVYNLIITINGCTSEAGSARVLVNELPLANAGSNMNVCINSEGIILAGGVTGGTATGMWSSSGTGTFFPSNTILNAKYIPSDADKNTGSVRLTLTSTSWDDCIPSVSSLLITFDELPVVQAGPDQAVCSQNPIVSLAGQVTVAPGAIWTTSGTGTFSPSNTALNAVYNPGSADIINGVVKLTLTASGNSACLPVTDQLIVRIIPPPAANAGPDIFVPLHRTITLNPSVNDPDVQYLWIPDLNLSNDTIRNPVFTAINDQVYSLRVTDSRGCVTRDEIFIDVLMPIIIPNTFTPNGDGINDVWNIAELSTYPGNTVNIYNRYGLKIFSSAGYNQPWDGTYNGEPAPVGTYYYIIDTQFPDLVYSGSITILR